VVWITSACEDREGEHHPAKAKTNPSNAHQDRGETRAHRFPQCADVALTGCKRCTIIARRLLKERERCKDGGRNEGLDVHIPRLPPNLSSFCRISNVFWPRIQVALTARREPHSRSISRLEKSQRPDEERKEQREPEQRPDSGKYKQKRNHDAHDDSRDSKYESLASFSRADVGDGGQ
jgi:hypothetical protein